LFKDERFKPDMLKIYPCLVTSGSKLHQSWLAGEYEPYTTEEAVDLIVEIKKSLPKWVRTMRIQRDIPSQLIESGVKKSNLGELVYQRMEDEGVQCNCIRCREVGIKARNNIYPEPENIKILRETYDANGGQEIFISTEDPENNVLLGFLRLRIPSVDSFRPEINKKTALIRELHIYGPMLPVGKRREDLWQHSGYGEDLLLKAQEIAKNEFDRDKILITSGIGAREYYRKFGYEREGPYMSKKI
jgi:elongator complex protein 3